MKKKLFFKLILFLLLSIFGISCSKGFQNAYEELKEPALSQPGVITTLITNITSVSAKSGGTIPDDGSSPVTQRGVCWSKNPNPGISDTCSSNGSGAGVYESIMTGLEANTLYYVRAYIKYKAGINYGAQTSFTTEISTYTLTDFKFTAANNAGFSVDCEGVISESLSGNTVKIGIPASASPTSLKASFSFTGQSIKIGSGIQISGATANNFSSPLVYSVYSLDGSKKDYTVTVYTYYTVSYNANAASGISGTLPVDSTRYLSGNIASVLANTGSLSRTGYDFAGWMTLPTGSSTVSSLTIGSADVIFYAKWNAKSSALIAYTSSAVCSSFTGTLPSNQNVYIGDLFTIPGDPNLLTCNGYDFIGWIAESAGATINYSFGQKVIIPAVWGSMVTFYPVWLAKPTYSVYFQANGADFGTPPSINTGYYNSIIDVPSYGTLSKTGFTFSHWNTKPDGTGTAYLEGNKITLKTSDIILYAIWQ